MKPTMHKFYTVVKGGRKGSKGQTRKIRKGSTKPGATKIGGVRHPY